MNTRDVNRLIMRLDVSISDLLTHFAFLNEESAKVSEFLGSESSEKFRKILGENRDFAKHSAISLQEHTDKLKDYIKTETGGESDNPLDPIL